MQNENSIGYHEGHGRITIAKAGFIVMQLSKMAMINLINDLNMVI